MQTAMRLKRKTLKIKPNSHGIFDLTAEEIRALEEASSQNGVWNFSTGVYMSGNHKGQVKVPDSFNLNSACILTVKEPGTTESERKVAGICMVPEDFVGSQCESGVIHAHRDYRLLCLEDNVNFWDCVPKEKRLKSWGSNKMKYIDVSVVNRVIQKVFAAANNEERRQEVIGFDDYFRQVNRL